MTSLRTRLLAAGLVAGLTGAAQAEDISVTHWGVLMYGAPYAVAMEKGLFKQAGVDVTGILSSQGGGTTVRNVLAGGLPFGEVALSAAVAATREGIDIKIVSGGARTVDDILWVVNPNSPIKTLADLKGKRIAFTSPKSVTEMLAVLMLDKAGLKPADVTLVSTGGIGAGLTALANGGVDIAPNMDPIWARTQDKYRPYVYNKDILPPIMQTVGITTPEFAQKSAGTLRAIIDGRRRGVDFIHRNPAEAGAIFAKAYKLDPKVAETSIRNMIAIDYWSRGQLDIEGMNQMVRGLQLVGGLPPGPVDWSKLIDRSFLPTDLRS
ncbi:MAG: ABC transporter substrate-binding protein [Alphaproteobacteria bacterium]|nr:ABC transporter substrate-binding protein [Alphaproteobacteria bacterium]